MRKKLTINESKEKLFKLMGKLNEDFMPPEDTDEIRGLPYQNMSDEDKILFKEIFFDEIMMSNLGITETTAGMSRIMASRFSGNIINAPKVDTWKEIVRDFLNDKVKRFNLMSKGHDMKIEEYEDRRMDYNNKLKNATFTVSFYPKGQLL
jgi:hypothetical protein